MARSVAIALLCLAGLAAAGCARAPSAGGSVSSGGDAPPSDEACARSLAADDAAALLRRLQGEGIVLYPAAVFPDPTGLSASLVQAAGPDSCVQPFLISSVELRGPQGTRRALIDGRVPSAVEAHAQLVVEGSLAPLTSEGVGLAPAIALGRGLAKELGIGLGDVVPIAAVDLPDAPTDATARVVAILGWPALLESYDDLQILASLPAARALVYGAPSGDELTGLTVYARSTGALGRVEGALLATPSRPYQLWTFEQLNRSLLAEVEALRRGCPPRGRGKRTLRKHPHPAPRARRQR